MPVLERVYTAWAGSGVIGILLRGIAAGICLLPPTMLMGATLPAISRWVQLTPQGVSWLGFFYGGNTLGAVLGSLLAGFYLLRVHDMVTATFVAVFLNVLVAGRISSRGPHHAGDGGRDGQAITARDRGRYASPSHSRALRRWARK
jgi:spermidine synthase